MTAPQGPTKKGYEIRPVATLPARPSVPITGGMSLEGPSAPPPSAPPTRQTPPPMAAAPSAPPQSANGLIAPAPPPSAPKQLAPELPPMPMRVAPQAPPSAYEGYVVEGVSDAANNLVRGAARDLPTEQSFVSTEKILDALFAYWQERCTLLPIVGTPPKGAWTYQDVVDGKVELEKDYAALIASAERLWLAQTDPKTRRPEADFVLYMKELLTNHLEPDQIPYHVQGGDVSETETRLLMAFQSLANALLFYKAAQEVDNPADKITLLTSGASAAGVYAMDNFAITAVPTVIKQYSRTLLSLKIGPALTRIGMK